MVSTREKRMELRAKEIESTQKVYVLSITDTGDGIVETNNVIASSDEVLVNSYYNIFQNIVANLSNSPETLKDITIEISVGGNIVSLSKENIDKVTFNITSLKNL